MKFRIVVMGFKLISEANYQTKTETYVVAGANMGEAEDVAMAAFGQDYSEFDHLVDIVFSEVLE
jgi:hypothetical protein